jgi:hypothetical protein
MSASSGSVYRDCRRAFIAAAEAAHVDTIARLHPSRDKDGGLLFMDSAALGPRLATRAILAIAKDASGSALMVRALKEPAPLPGDTRLVLIHALDPAAFAGVQTDPAWPAAMLQAVATEDLSRVKRLGVLALGTDGLPPLPPLARAEIIVLPPVTDIAGIAAALTGIARN